MNLRMPFPFPTLGTLIACCAAVLPAQEKLVDLAAELAPLVEQHKVPALGAAVIVDGKLVALGASGVRKAGDPTAVTADDLWHLGSCTKAMTATLLARYVDRGKLKWNQTVAELLPDLAEKMHERARAITIADLLEHRAGLPGMPPGPLWREMWDYQGTLSEARTECAATMLGVAPEAAPGERFLYSNASYMIAGAIAERIGGAPWEELMRRELFTPLGMASAGFGAPGTAERLEQPCGHRFAKPPVAVPPGPGADNPAAIGPAGTVHSSLRDWSRFVALHLAVRDDQQPFLKPATLATLHTVRRGEYALGWVVTERPWAKGPVLWHNGSNTMWYCVTWMAPQQKFAVLVTCNQGNGQKACDDAAAALIRRFKPSADK